MLDLDLVAEGVHEGDAPAAEAAAGWAPPAGVPEHGDHIRGAMLQVDRDDTAGGAVGVFDGVGTRLADRGEQIGGGLPVGSDAGQPRRRVGEVPIGQSGWRLNRRLLRRGYEVLLAEDGTTGLRMAEAMAHGVPVVATAYSGNMDFMDADSAFLVRPPLV